MKGREVSEEGECLPLTHHFKPSNHTIVLPDADTAVNCVGGTWAFDILEKGQPIQIILSVMAEVTATAADAARNHQDYADVATVSSSGGESK